MHEAAVPQLTECLRNADEHPMVRHEVSTVHSTLPLHRTCVRQAAEALGSIAHPSVNELLEEYRSDPEPVSRHGIGFCP